MMHREFLAATIREATAQVFSTMLGMTVVDRGAPQDEEPAEPAEGLVGFIGLAGEWVGTGSLCCSGEVACKLSGQMLMTEYAAVNDEVLDAVAELTNMIIGNVKTALEPEFGPMGLSIPTVIYGRNFRINSYKSTDPVAVCFDCDGHEVIVRLCLTPRASGQKGSTGQEVGEACAALG
jgi:chemotaxis protein CheX